MRKPSPGLVRAHVEAELGAIASLQRIQPAVVGRVDFGSGLPVGQVDSVEVAQFLADAADVQL